MLRLLPGKRVFCSYTVGVAAPEADEGVVAPGVLIACAGDGGVTPPRTFLFWAWRHMEKGDKIGYLDMRS